jgi:hypothetical protein
MRPDKTLFALIMLGSLAGCYPPAQSSFSPLPAEPPQPLHPAYGYAAPTASVPPLPLTMPPCTVCNQTRTIVPVGWYP